MRSVTPLFLLFLALGVIEAAPRPASLESGYSRYLLKHLNLGRSIDPIDGDLIGRSLDPIGGGNLVGRSIDPIDGDLIGRSLDGIGGGNLVGRSIDPIDGDLIGRSLDGIGGGNLVGRGIDGIDGNLIGRSIDPIDGDLIGRSIDPIDGDLIGRSLDRIGGGNLVGRSIDGIDGNLIGRSIDPIDGDLIGRSVDPIDGDLIKRRKVDINGLIRRLNGHRRAKNAYGEGLMGQKAIRSFGILQLGGGYGVAKRLAPSGNKYDTKSEKQRRGPLNGLIPGGAFGRAARSCVRNCYPLMKLLKGRMDEKYHPYFSFELVDSDDGQSKGSSDVDKTYQYKHSLGLQ